MTALAINFSSGSLFGIRNDSGVANPTPVKFGVMQDGSIEFNATNKELFGQNQFPVDVARGEIKVMGKSKIAQISAQWYDLFFGQGVVQNQGLQVALGEAHNIPGTGAYTVTPTNASTFLQDLGVLYAATGIPFGNVAAGSEAAGLYSYNKTTGVYTFSAADEGVAVQISYEYGGTTGLKEINLTNQLMGSAPTLTMILATTFKGNVMNIHLNQVISEKLSFPWKNTDYSILDFDFQAYSDAAGNLGKITTSQ
jgi:hypothetical protein